ncbi:hypothetical protein [Solidesulfovibrio sp.]
MRRFKLFLALLAVAAILCAPAVSSAALTGKINGTVNFVYTNGASPAVSIINITYMSGSTSTTTNFVVPSASANTFIAMALSAQAAGKGISFQADGTTLYSLWVNSN